jgi:hypothetical protein
MAKATIMGKFGVIPVEFLENAELSFSAKGLYAYLSSKPDGWDVTVENIAKEALEDRWSIETIIQELVDSGLLIQEIETLTYK